MQRLGQLSQHEQAPIFTVSLHRPEKDDRTQQIRQEKDVIIDRILLVPRVLLAGLFLTLIVGCEHQTEPLLVYAGKGLRHPMEEIKSTFEHRTNIPVSVVYAGSDTLLTTLRTSMRGDVYVPGSQSYIKSAGELATSDAFVARHVPVFVVRATQREPKLTGYASLLQPGVRIAIGNKDMAAIGRVAEAILRDIGPELSFRHNVVVTGSTVNELLGLVANGEVDAALVWTDMLLWDKAKGLVKIEIPEALNKSKEIRVATLATSTRPDDAARFAEFVATDGRAVFSKYGF